jgi:biopolymer transport protein ExbD
MSLSTRRRRRRPEINIVPLVDVLIVLIFFFLMTMQFRTRQALDITPPKMDTAGPSTTPQRLVVAIDKTGQYSLDGAPITSEQLPAELKKAAAAQGADATLLILADQDTPLKNVTFVMDESRKLQLEKIRLQTR